MRDVSAKITHGRNQVFGESILNDAVAIVLTTTVLESGSPGMENLTSLEQVGYGILRFVVVFLGSAGKWD